MIAHELAHSWSGNLVTNASWEHFWLNEGWTMYIQRRVSQSSLRTLRCSKAKPVQLEAAMYVLRTVGC